MDNDSTQNNITTVSSMYINPESENINRFKTMNPLNYITALKNKENFKEINSAILSLGKVFNVNYKFTLNVTLFCVSATLRFGKDITDFEMIGGYSLEWTINRKFVGKKHVKESGNFYLSPTYYITESKNKQTLLNFLVQTYFNFLKDLVMKYESG